MTKLEGDRDASRDLERIRALMERATEFSHLSGWSIATSGLLAAAGAGLCLHLGADFDLPAHHAGTLARVWGAVAALAAAQGVAFSVVNARRKGEPVWSHLTRQVVVAMLPAIFTGAALTGYAFQTAKLDLLPGCWMLAYGSSLMGLGLFAGRAIRVAALAFLVLGAISLLLLRDRGLVLMLLSFGGLHLVLGAWVLWKRRA